MVSITMRSAKLFLMMACLALQMQGGTLELGGIMQYPAVEHIDWSLLDYVKQKHLCDLVLKSMLIPRKNPDVDIYARKIDGSDRKSYRFNLKAKQKISLPKGTYRFECTTHDISIAKRHNGDGWCIQSKPVVQIPETNAVTIKIRVLCYSKGSRISLRGRLVNVYGQPLPNHEIYGQPLMSCRNDNDFHQSAKSRTDAFGRYEFSDLPPASLDIAVQYMLMDARRCSSLTASGDKVLNFAITAQKDGCTVSTNVPLLSAGNLVGVQHISKRIWEALPTEMKANITKAKPISSPHIPVSTNNVIYVGDIVLPGKKRQ